MSGWAFAQASGVTSLICQFMSVGRRVAGEHVAQIDLWIDGTTATGFDDREEDGAAPKATSASVYSNASSLYHSTPNPITLFSFRLSPECSAFAFRAFLISASIIVWLTSHCSGFPSVLPA